jgi:6,7-dimethyl-8-ribityllumazine synthase
MLVQSVVKVTSLQTDMPKLVADGVLTKEEADQAANTTLERTELFAEWIKQAADMVDDGKRKM